jgi:hypothetical protein
MKSIVRSSVVLIVLAAARLVSGQDQIPWAADYRQACELAAQQKRLVLLHFYSDDCPPCVRVEQNVFSRPEVAQAIARNYVPVKIHAGQNPDLVSRYQVTRWPTDVAISPAGLEIHRSTSPQLPEHYVELVDLMALKAGVGSGRQWADNMRQMGQATLDQAAGAAQGMTEQARSGAQQWSQQAQDAARQFGQQTQNAVDQYQQQTQGAVQQYRNQAQGAVQQWNQQATGAAQQFGQQAAAAGQQFQNAVQQQADAGRTAIDRWNSSFDPRASNSATSSPPFIVREPVAQSAAAAPPNSASTPEIAMNPFVGQSQNAPANSSAWQPPVQQAIQSAPQGGTQFVAASQAPPVALGGYCPVTLAESRRWQKADPQFGAIHRGCTYLFTTAGEQTRFLADPDAYAPVLSGYDPVRFAKTGQLVAGSPAFANTFRNRLFLFADAAARDEFEQSPAQFAEPAYQAMMRSETAPAYR